GSICEDVVTEPNSSLGISGRNVPRGRGRSADQIVIAAKNRDADQIRHRNCAGYVCPDIITLDNILLSRIKTAGGGNVCSLQINAANHRLRTAEHAYPSERTAGAIPYRLRPRHVGTNQVALNCVIGSQRKNAAVDCVEPWLDRDPLIPIARNDIAQRHARTANGVSRRAGNKYADAIAQRTCAESVRSDQVSLNQVVRRLGGDYVRGNRGGNGNSVVGIAGNYVSGL